MMTKLTPAVLSMLLSVYGVSGLTQNYPDSPLVMTKAGVVINTNQVSSQWNNELIITTPTSDQQQLRGGSQSTNGTLIATTQSTYKFVGFDQAHALALAEPTPTSSCSSDKTFLFVMGSQENQQSSTTKQSTTQATQICSLELPSDGTEEPQLSDCYILPSAVSMFSSMDVRDGTIVIYMSGGSTTDLYKLDYDCTTGIMDNVQALKFEGMYDPSHQQFFTVDSALILDSTTLVLGWTSQSDSQTAIMTLNPSTGGMDLQREFSTSSTYYDVYYKDNDQSQPYVYRGVTLDVINPYEDPTNDDSPNPNPSTTFQPDDQWAQCTGSYVAVNQNSNFVVVGPCFLPSEMGGTVGSVNSMQVYSINKSEPTDTSFVGLLPVSAINEDVTGFATGDGTDLTAYMNFSPGTIGIQSISEAEHVVPSGATSRFYGSVILTLSAVIGTVASVI